MLESCSLGHVFFVYNSICLPQKDFGYGFWYVSLGVIVNEKKFVMNRIRYNTHIMSTRYAAPTVTYNASECIRRMIRNGQCVGYLDWCVYFMGVNIPATQRENPQIRCCMDFAYYGIILGLCVAISFVVDYFFMLVVCPLNTRF